MTLTNLFLLFLRPKSSSRSSPYNYPMLFRLLDALAAYPGGARLAPPPAWRAELTRYLRAAPAPAVAAPLRAALARVGLPVHLVPELRDGGLPPNVGSFLRRVQAGARGGGREGRGERGERLCRPRRRCRWCDESRGRNSGDDDAGSGPEDNRGPLRGARPRRPAAAARVPGSRGRVCDLGVGRGERGEEGGAEEEEEEGKGGKGESSRPLGLASSSLFHRHHHHPTTLRKHSSSSSWNDHAPGGKFAVPVSEMGDYASAVARTPQRRRRRNPCATPLPRRRRRSATRGKRPEGPGGGSRRRRRRSPLATPMLPTRLAGGRGGRGRGRGRGRRPRRRSSRTSIADRSEQAGEAAARRLEAARRRRRRCGEEVADPASALGGGSSLRFLRKKEEQKTALHFCRSPASTTTAVKADPGAAAGENCFSIFSSSFFAALRRPKEKKNSLFSFLRKKNISSQLGRQPGRC